MYRINRVDIDGNRLVAHVTIALDAKTSIDATVPVFDPQSSDDVIAAIEDRIRNEQVQFDAAPVLNAIKAELEGEKVGRPQESTAQAGILSRRVR